jgi:UDPglucose 6-dehydrogenase
MEKIGIVGLWHLGCVLTSVWSKLGNKVIGFDFENEKIINLNKGIAPIYEPNLEESIRNSLDKNLLKFTNNITELNECDFVFITYDTPVDESDISDTTILIKAINELKFILKNNCTIIVSSQTPVGFSRNLELIVKEANNSIELVVSPENLRLGEAIECYLKPGRIIIGSLNSIAKRNANNLFSQLNTELLHMSIESAEVVKHGINSFLATSIVFANQIADICEIKNANIIDVIKGIKSDVRIGEKAYLVPGIGFSGGTLGRDLQVLKKTFENQSFDTNFFAIVHEINYNRKYSIINKVDKYLNGIKDKNIGILGLTYKPGTSTLRRSLPLEIVNELNNRGAKVKVYDSLADYKELENQIINFEITDNINQVALEAHIIILLTESVEYKSIDWNSIYSLMSEHIIFDTKFYLDSNKLINQGFKYITIGNENF